MIEHRQRADTGHLEEAMTILAQRHAIPTDAQHGLVPTAARIGFFQQLQQAIGEAAGL